MLEIKGKVNTAVCFARVVEDEAIEQIRKKFNIPLYTTVNGESPCEVDEEEMQLLRQCEERGFLSIRNKKWCKKGEVFVW